MDFQTWASDNGFDLASMSDAAKTKLQAAWRAELNPVPSPEPTKPAAKVTESAGDTESFTKTVEAIEAENHRREGIRERGVHAMRMFVGNSEKTKQLRELTEAAVADEKTTIKDFELALMRAERFQGPNVFIPNSQPEINEDVVTAAICMTHKLPNLEKQFNARTLETAHARFRGGMRLGNLVHHAARKAGYRGEILGEANMLDMWRAANRHRFGGYEPMAASGSGLSTLDITGILSNVANKFMGAQFLYGEQSWRRISKIATANDFKQMSTYRLTGNNKFVKVPPGGEIKHGTLSELSYTNQVETYGIMLGIDRRDFINDDLGALTGRAAEIGIGAIDNLNEVFWTEWLNDSTFFPTDKSLANYDDGATDSVLSLAGLENADTIFGLQTKPNGTPLGVQPRILLVPRALRNTAMNLMANAITASAQSTATVTVANTWAGMFEVVDSVYLQSSSITGYSATAWYLLADPMNLPAIEVAFLYGRDTPTIEESELAFDRLGMSMRAYLDWGCNKQEYRAGVKLKGAA